VYLLELLSSKYEIREKDGRLLGKLYPNFFNLTTIKSMNSWIESFGEQVGVKVRDSRGAHKVVKAGRWIQQGHYTLHGPKKNLQILEQFRIKWTIEWNRIADEVRKNFPSFIDSVRDVPQQELPFGDIFSFFICNVSNVSEFHRDFDDNDLCVVIPLGEFEGGRLEFPYLKVNVRIRSGDLFIFNSRELWHGLGTVTGNRHSIVLTTQKSLIRVSTM